MEKPFTIKVNDLQHDIIEKINQAQMPCYVLKNILQEIIKMIEDADGEEITKYLNQKQEEKESEE